MIERDWKIYTHPQLFFGDEIFEIYTTSFYNFKKNPNYKSKSFGVIRDNISNSSSKSFLLPQIHGFVLHTPLTDLSDLEVELSRDSLNENLKGVFKINDLGEDTFYVSANLRNRELVHFELESLEVNPLEIYISKRIFER